MNHPKEILQIGSPILEEKTKKVNNVHTKSVQETISNLRRTFDKYRERSAGLAAPQIGKSLSICIVGRYDIDGDKKDQQSELLINPQIINKSTDTSVFWEGCLSIGWGDNGLFAPVERHNTVEISYISEKGEEKKLVGDGFFSHVLQHEIDHLQGRLFLSYVKDPESIWKSVDLDNYIIEHGEYPPTDF